MKHVVHYSYTDEDVAYEDVVLVKDNYILGELTSRNINSLDVILNDVSVFIESNLLSSDSLSHEDKDYPVNEIDFDKKYSFNLFLENAGLLRSKGEPTVRIDYIARRSEKGAGKLLKSFTSYEKALNKVFNPN